jgi:hypothetical protein
MALDDLALIYQGAFDGAGAWCQASGSSSPGMSRMVVDLPATQVFPVLRSRLAHRSDRAAVFLQGLRLGVSESAGWRVCRV